MNIRSCILVLAVTASVWATVPVKGQLGTDRVAFEFALYFAPAPSADPEHALEALLRGEFSSMRESVTVLHQWVDLHDYPPPSLESFPYLTVDLKPSLAPALFESDGVFVLIFESNQASLFRANREANALTYRLAELTDSLLWDGECRLLYSREAWLKRRVQTWQDDTPDVRGHINMHAYRDPELVRIITLGMRKFGLPDLVVAETPSGQSRVAGNFVNACAQRMIEGQPNDDLKFELVLTDIRHDGVRENLLENPLKGATGRLSIELIDTPPEEGDPDNRLFTLDFPKATGDGSAERLAAAMASLFGAEGQVVRRNAGDDELMAASQQARQEFQAKLDGFRNGFEPNERLVVKVPFTYEGQTEYMWVEVFGWGKGSLRGVLMNDSHFNERLRVGQKLSVDFEDIYDYIHYKPDGTMDGNMTGKVLGYD